MRRSEVAFVQDMINGRRRKSLGGKRPKDFLRELAKSAPIAVGSDEFFDPFSPPAIEARF